MDEVALAQVFSKYFDFPYQSSIHPLLLIHHYLSSGLVTRGQPLAAVPSGLSLKQPQKTKKKIVLLNKKN
jgi:hypothetical protein